MTTTGDDNNNFQRSGSVSNAHVGREFEAMAKKYFRREYPDHPELQEEFAVDIGLSNKKEKRFDLGAANPAILVECKSHTWTRGGNVPSAKIAVWNETMYYFHLAPKGFRKVLFVQREINERNGKSLGEYYVKHHGHLIPEDVEILEYDQDRDEVIKVWPK